MQISDIKSSLRKFFKNPYRIVVFNDSNLHIIKQLRFNARTLVLGLVSALFVVIIAVSVLIAFTPLREYIPGYPTGEMRQTLINSALTVDSLEQKIHTYDRYFQDFQAMLAGENLSGTNVKEDSIVRPDLSKLRQSNSDSIFKDELRQEKFQLSGSGQSGSQRQNAAELLFFPPVKGVIPGKFDASIKHYGTDIVGKLNSRISAALDGTVVFAEWTMTTGYVVMVQHGQNITTCYKHNSELLKKQGERVRAGEAIAIMGNTGKETTGPHLHFEIWIDGTAVNPEEYIRF